MLNPESLEVVSFFPSSEPASLQAQQATGASQSPDCIVYVSDCVSCFPDGVNA